MDEEKLNSNVLSNDTATVYCNDVLDNTGAILREHWAEKTYDIGEIALGSDFGTDTFYYKDHYYSYKSCTSVEIEDPEEEYTVSRNLLESFIITCKDRIESTGEIIQTLERRLCVYHTSISGSDWDEATYPYPSGYTYISCTTISEISEDGTVYRNFKSNQYPVTCTDKASGPVGTILGTTTKSFNLGTTVRGNDVSTTTYTNYDFNNDTSCVVTIGTNNVYRYFVNYHNLTYDLDGGTATGEMPILVTYATSIIVPAPTKSGYTFIGWNITGMSDNEHSYTDMSGVVHTFTGTSIDLACGIYFYHLSTTPDATVSFKAIWSADGLGRIYSATDKKYHSALCYVYSNGSYHQAIPYIYSNGIYKIGT